MRRIQPEIKPLELSHSSGYFDIRMDTDMAVTIFQSIFGPRSVEIAKAVIGEVERQNKMRADAGLGELRHPMVIG